MAKKKDDDIQVINRDYEFDFPLSPLIDNNELAQLNQSNQDNSNININGNTNSNGNNNVKGNVNINGNITGNKFENLDHDNEEIEEINTGLTPMMNNFDDDQHQLITQPKLYSNLPPLQPLSESVLPTNFNFNQPPTTQLIESNNLNNKKKKDNGPKTRPAFVMKIWSMVNDEKNNQYIRWDNDGNTFQVFHREEFMKNILPKYFKHNNFASFVRQLNMYGWHKVQDINNGILKDDKTIEENWKFENPYFKKGREDLLDNIIRNKSINQQDSDLIEKGQNLKTIINELEGIKMNQLAITEDLRRIRKDNKTLWQENFITRDRHSKQSQTIDKILKFLASIYGQQNKILEVEDFNLDNDLVNGNNNNNGTNNINNSSINNANNNEFNNLFEELPSSISSPQPQPKQRLMLMNQAYKTPSSAGSMGNIEPIENNSLSNSLHNTPKYDDNELINGLEQNIYKQGQTIQQVQDWIQKLSNQQQQLQVQQNNLQNQQSIQNANSPGNLNTNGTGTPKFDLDFDVNDFLHQHTPNNEEEEFQPRRKKFKPENSRDGSQIEELN